MIGLPSRATEDSHIRYKLAQTLVNLAPPSFGHESVLTGSASRGVADNYSDVEMMFYVDALPSREDRKAWLHNAGAANIVLDTESPQDGVTILPGAKHTLKRQREGTGGKVAQERLFPPAFQQMMQKRAFCRHICKLAMSDA